MYFSSSHSYASKYADEVNRIRVFVVCFVMPGNVYPVTEPPKLPSANGNEVVNPNGFLGKGCMDGYQSHYTLGKWP